MARGNPGLRQQRFLPLLKVNLTGIFHRLVCIENSFPLHIWLLTSPVWFVYVLLIVRVLSWWLIFQADKNDLFISWKPES
jgi:hypothetical protein